MYDEISYIYRNIYRNMTIGIDHSVTLTQRSNVVLAKSTAESNDNMMESIKSLKHEMKQLKSDLKITVEVKKTRKKGVLCKSAS